MEKMIIDAKLIKKVNKILGIIDGSDFNAARWIKADSINFDSRLMSAISEYYSAFARIGNDDSPMTAELDPTYYAQFSEKGVKEGPRTWALWNRCQLLKIIAAVGSILPLQGDDKRCRREPKDIFEIYRGNFWNWSYNQGYTSTADGKSPEVLHY